jgi:putative transposase
MGRLFHPLLFLLAQSTSDDLQKQIEFLKAENELLRRRVPNQRIFLKADERARMLKLGKQRLRIRLFSSLRSGLPSVVPF